VTKVLVWPGMYKTPPGSGVEGYGIGKLSKETLNSFYSSRPRSVRERRESTDRVQRRGIGSECLVSHTLLADRFTKKLFQLSGLPVLCELAYCRVFLVGEQTLVFQLDISQCVYCASMGVGDTCAEACVV